MDDYWEEDDVISKLLDQNFHHQSSVECSLKSLHDELVEVGEFTPPKVVTVPEVEQGCEIQPKVITENFKRNTRSFKLDNVMVEFMQLSGIMDREITRHNSNIVKEQKESLKSKEQGKLDVLKELLLDQQNEMKKREQENDRKMNEMKVEYEKKVKSLQEALKRQQNVNKELQMEFNRTLEEKEQEIEDMIAENADLRHELSTKETDCYELSMEVNIILFFIRHCHGVKDRCIRTE